MALAFLTGCASVPPQASAPSTSEQAQVQQRLGEIFHAAETKDLLRLDSYHWYGPHFTKFAGTGHRLDAAAAREGEHKGLSALAGLKLRADDLQIDVFHDAAVATFTMVVTIQSGADAITKRERGTLVFVKHEGSWKIVHEHFSVAE
jgi:ketosteroid isomerase-like protein